MRTIETERGDRRTIQLRRTHHNSLCDAVSKILDTGVVALGEVKLSVADVDLVYVGLQLVITSIQSSDDSFADRPDAGQPWYRGESKDPDCVREEPEIDLPCEPRPTFPTPRPGEEAQVFSTREIRARAASILPEASDGKEKNGLGQLVLTVVKLLHELMKKQALRRMEGGDLNAYQLERLGDTLRRQSEALKRLRDEFGLTDEDLNLDLGPLGKLF